MSEKIYLIDETESLHDMSEQPYENEDRLQALLEDYPDLLAGEQINQKSPRRWLLISREMGVPSEEQSGDRWSLDHLFVDQDGVPTLVEVKRSSDNRIRRQVVGQMLDYAANAVVYWPIERIQAEFERQCESNGTDAEAELADFLESAGEDTVLSPETFWSTVKTNLQAGKIRMVFVADKIPQELQCIVEFLNEQTDPAEVLAVELKQFVGGGVRTLVPRVLGLTAAAQQKKSAASAKGKQWDETSFMEEFKKRQGEENVGVAAEILRWLEKHERPIFWGKGRTYGTYGAYVTADESDVLLLNVSTNGFLYVAFNELKKKINNFAEETQRLELLRQLNAIKGISLPREVIERSPTVPLSVLKDPDARNQFLRAMEWVFEQITGKDTADELRGQTGT